MFKNGILLPTWPAPQNVQAVISTRQGGFSMPPFSSLNLGNHVGDNPQHVLANRKQFQLESSMPSSPVWLNQVHGTYVLQLDDLDSATLQNQYTTTSGLPSLFNADASVTSQKGVVATVMTADCLPLLVCDTKGTQVAAIHAGWRGLCDGIIENTLKHFANPAEVLVYLGPAIGPSSFEVGAEVKAAFVAKDAKAEMAFIARGSGKYLANLYELAKMRLALCSVTQVYGGTYCTYLQEDLFFSYRRDGQTGRLASSIWLT